MDEHDLFSGSDLPGVPPGAQRWKTRRDLIGGRGNRPAPRRVDLATSDESEWKPESQAAAQLIREALGDERVSEVHGLGPDQLFVKFRGEHRALQARFADEQDYNAFLKRLVDESEHPSDTPWLDVQRRHRGVIRMSDGSSLTLVMPPFTPATIFTVRKHNMVSWTAEDLVANGTFTGQQMAFLQAAVAARANMLVVGQVGSGKTSVLSLLTRSFSDAERVGVIEEVPEIWIDKRQVLYATYQPSEQGLALADILDSALYLRFDRLIIGEIHLEGLTKMLENMLTGNRGAMSTYHAGSVDEAIERMKIGLQLENRNMTTETALSMIRNALDLVVVLGRTNGVHRCLEIAEIGWRASANPNTIERQRLWEYDFAGNRHRVVGRLDDRSRLRDKAAQYGVTFRPDWFADPEAVRRLGR